jgi:hypothetical protein
MKRRPAREAAVGVVETDLEVDVVASADERCHVGSR